MSQYLGGLHYIVEIDESLKISLNLLISYLSQIGDFRLLAWHNMSLYLANGKIGMLGFIVKKDGFVFGIR